MQFIGNTFIVFGIFLCSLSNLWATHNRAGEITYEQIGELTIRVTITTYTRTSSFAADRDSLELFWGDGTRASINRSNDSGMELPNDIKVNFYIAEHTYPTRGTYKLTMTDPNRIAGILNIDFPNSVNIPFYIETTFTLLDTRFQGKNNSAILLQPPIDYACINEIFTHNPNAYDPDGDSLSYELITPFQSENEMVPNYILPNEVNPGPENQISLNSMTGDFVWNTPKIQGEFNITFRINEYREGVLINSIIRDMQILVRTCLNANKPPIIESIEEICVIAGDEVRIDIVATDPDTGQNLRISALGGPFEVSQGAAHLEVSNQTGLSLVRATFVWNTECAHIMKEFYQVVIKAEDDFFELGTGLATLKTIRIKVVGPPPRDVIAEKIDGSIKISWESPYACENEKLFQGFSLWRMLGTTNVPLDTCSPGLDGTGYEEIIFLTIDKEGDRFVAFDAEVGESKIYCYRVLGEFALLTDSGNPFNKVESLRSNESCVQFDRKNPIITGVSVNRTDMSMGEMEVKWILPDPVDVDTLIHPGPYSLQLERAVGISSSEFDPVTGATFQSNSFSGLRDTFFIDKPLNTDESGFNYRVSFFTDDTNEFFSKSDQASSIFLQGRGNDLRVGLTWSENVPWNNYSYTIYRVDPSGRFDSLGITDSPSFVVHNLVNGVEACFAVKSTGKYGPKNIPEPISNFSEIVCAIPVDSLAPCPPTLSVNTVCDKPIVEEVDALVNTISWTFSAEKCLPESDLDHFNIYFSQDKSSALQLLQSIDANNLSFDHELSNVISGCYALTAVDLSNNESEFSNIVCVDNCPSYELANSFTPNQDGSNDFFEPRINLFIDHIDLEIYNRWGQVVFKTTNPVIHWDGSNQNGKELADATYYYTCKVFEQRVTGIVEQDVVLSGYIQLIRGK